MTKTILAVDDSKTIRQAIEWTFLASEFSVRTAESASEAFAQLGAAPPDLVLVDVSLPDQDGYQVARSIRAQQPNLPIVLLTSSHSAFDPDHAEASGVSAHIGKPFDTQALLDLVESQLAAASAEPPVPLHAIPEMPAPLAGSMPPATPPTAAEDGSDGLELDPFAEPGSASAWDDGVQADPGWGQADAGPQLDPPPPPSSGATAEPVDVWALSEEVAVDDAEVIEDIDIEDVPDEEFMPASAPPAPPEPADPTPVSLEPAGWTAPEADPMPSWDPVPPSPQPPPPQPPPSAAPALGSALAATAAPDVADAAAAQLPPGLSRDTLEQLARQVIEQIAWEVVPELAEVIIREELARLTEDEESVRKPD